MRMHITMLDEMELQGSNHSLSKKRLTQKTFELIHFEAFDVVFVN